MVLHLYINNKHEKKLSIIEIYHGKQFTNKQHKIGCSDKGLICFGSCMLSHLNTKAVQDETFLFEKHREHFDF